MFLDTNRFREAYESALARWLAAMGSQEVREDVGVVVVAGVDSGVAETGD